MCFIGLYVNKTRIRIIIITTIQIEGWRRLRGGGDARGAVRVTHRRYRRSVAAKGS